jgi:hypothetical protein
MVQRDEGEEGKLAEASFPFGYFLFRYFFLVVFFFADFFLEGIRYHLQSFSQCGQGLTASKKYYEGVRSQFFKGDATRRTNRLHPKP